MMPAMCTGLFDNPLLYFTKRLFLAGVLYAKMERFCLVITQVCFKLLLSLMIRMCVSERESERAKVCVRRRPFPAINTHYPSAACEA